MSTSMSLNDNMLSFTGGESVRLFLSKSKSKSKSKRKSYYPGISKVVSTSLHE